MIDAAIGEASDLRYRSAVLQRAVSGLMETIVAWRWAAFEIAGNRDAAVSGEAHAIHDQLPRDRLSPDALGSAKTPAELREACCAAARFLTHSGAQTPSQRLLADSAAIGMLGLARALNGLTGVVDPSDMIPVKGTAQLHVPDWLPPFVSALRVFLAVGAISLFWIASAWPSGALAITFCAVIVVLLPLQGDLAYSASMTFLKGCVLGAVIAAVLEFAILPRVTTFPTLCLALGLAYVPLGFLLARSKTPLFYFAASVNFLPMISVTNGITYDASQFWNSSSGILVGVACGAIAMRILPPVPPAIRTQRLLALALADLRRLATRASPGRQEDWVEAAASPVCWRCPTKPTQSNARSSSPRSPSAEKSCGCAVSRPGSCRGRGRGRGASSFGRRTKRRGDRAPEGHRPPARRPAPRRGRKPHPVATPSQHPGDFRSARRIRPLFRRPAGLMRFNEINLFGLYVAPIVVILAVAWIVYLLIRRVADRFGLTPLVWHPALFELALYVMIVSSIVVMIARWSR